jgi:hypothetical protein
MAEAQEELTIKLNVKHSIEKLQQAQQLVGELRAIKQRAANAEELLIALLNDWEVDARDERA